MSKPDREALAIVDTHTHVISTDREAYPLNPRSLSGQWYLESAVDGPGLAGEMEACGVSQAVLVQAVGAYSYDNRYVADAVRADPSRFVGACCIDVQAPDACETLRHWIEDAGLRGIRIFALSAGDSWLEDEATFPVWETAHALGAHVIVTVLPQQMGELDRVLQRFAEIPISLDHCGFPAMADDSSRATDVLLGMARHANLHLKVTTNVLDGASSREGGASSLVRDLVSVYGSDRIMWGSDYCQTQDRSYAALVEGGVEAFSGLSAAEQRDCLSGTARRLWPTLRGGVGG